jgi:hypothetical protein
MAVRVALNRRNGDWLVQRLSNGQEKFASSLIVRKLLLIVGQGVVPPFHHPHGPFFHSALNRLHAAFEPGRSSDL